MKEKGVNRLPPLHEVNLVVVSETFSFSFSAFFFADQKATMAVPVYYFEL